MKTTTTLVSNAINQDYAPIINVVASAEWNNNAMYRTVVDNTPAEADSGYDLDLFPIESITRPYRPQKAGIVKAIAGQAFCASSSTHGVPDTRYYIVDDEDTYKYWQSQNPSDASGNMTNCAPQVGYYQELNDASGNPIARTVKANKIHFVVENTFSNPVTYDIQVKLNTTDAWTTVASNITVPLGGNVNLWYNGTSWTTTKALGSNLDMFGVRLVINKMSVPNSYFNLIELGLALELDVSNDVTGISSQLTLSDPDFITPLGTVSANTGSINLFDENRLYNRTNPNSILFGLLDKGVKFTVSYQYQKTDTVQDFVMYSDDWDETDAETSVSLVDYTRFFQDIKPRKVLYRNVPVQEAIWRLLDCIGFNSYKIEDIDTQPNAMLDIFWTDGEQTIWEVFQELSRATQTAIYFDAYNVLHVKTRNAAFNSTAAPVGTLLRDTDGTNLPNIVSLQDKKQYEANQVKITYKPTAFSQQQGYIIGYDTVWQPDDTLVVRASVLRKTMSATDMVVHIDPKEAATWLWKGMFQIEGEWISYEGKEYNYFSKGSFNTVIVKTYAQQQAYDALTSPQDLYKNNYTGKMIITERGVYNTYPAPHSVDISGWRTARQRKYGASNPSGGAVQNKNESSVTITMQNGTFDDYTYFNRGSVNDQGFTYIGTRMMIDKGAFANKTAGIFINADGGLGTGYFIEFTASDALRGKLGNAKNEVNVYSMKADGSKKAFGGLSTVTKSQRVNGKKVVKTTTNIGEHAPIILGNYFDVDIVFYNNGANDIIVVYVNGAVLISATITPDWQHSKVGLWGLYVRGKSRATFEYVYAVNNFVYNKTSTGIGQVYTLDQYGNQYWDRFESSWRSNQWMKDFAYQSRFIKKKKKKNQKVRQLYNQRFFDDFGPYLHEIRDFEVSFDSDTPVLQSKLYLSNYYNCMPLSYSADNSSARFRLANTSRTNAILSGDDDLTSQGQGTINQKIFVYGRPAVFKDEATIIKKDDYGIRRRGVIETTFDSKWIQNADDANALATWITSNWSHSDSVLTVEIFGNPLYELTDVVTVVYRDINTTYYVVGIENSFDRGLTTTLTLRKT